MLRTPHESAFENISKDRSASVDCEDDLPPEASDPQPAPLLHTPLHLARDGRNCTLRKHREWSGCVHFPPDCAPAGYGATADSEQLRRTADCALLVQPGARVVHPAPIGQRATDLRAIRVYRKAATGERIAPRATAQSRTHANWTQAGKDRAELPAHSPHLCLRPARTVRRQHPHRRQQPPMADCWTSRMRCTSNARSRAISSARSASSRSADVVTTIKSTRDSFSRARRPTEGSPPQATAPRASIRRTPTWKPAGPAEYGLQKPSVFVWVLRKIGWSKHRDASNHRPEHTRRYATFASSVYEAFSPPCPETRTSYDSVFLCVYEEVSPPCPQF